MKRRMINPRGYVQRAPARPSLLARAFAGVVKRTPVLGPWLRRMERRMDVAMEERNYLAAQNNRLTAGMHAQARLTTADQEYAQDGSKLIAVARQAVRNVDMAATLVAKSREKALGWRGIVPQFGTKSKNLNSELSGAFAADAKITGEGAMGLRGESWFALQRMMMNELMTAGECFVYQGVYRGRWCVGMFESEDLLCVSSGMVATKNGEKIVGGIRYDADGIPISYLVQDVQPGSFGRQFVQYREIPARQVHHVYLKDRPSQWRGVSSFDATLMGVNDIGETDYAELVGMKQSACVGLVIEEPEGDPLDEMGAEDETDPADGSTRRVINFQPGAVNSISGTVKLLDPVRPGNQYLPYIMTRLKRIAARFGLTYNSVSGDTSQANYSSMRADQMGQLGTTEDRQQALTEQALEHLARGWAEWQLLTGRVRARGHEIGEIMAGVEWQYPGVAPVSPKEQAATDVLEIGAGLKTLGQALSERGLDLRQQLAAMAAEKELLAEYGFNLQELLAQAGVMAAAALATASNDQGGQSQGGKQLSA